MRHVLHVALDTVLIAFIAWRLAVIARDAYYAWWVSHELGEMTRATGEAVHTMSVGDRA